MDSAVYIHGHQYRGCDRIVFHQRQYAENLIQAWRTGRVPCKFKFSDTETCTDAAQIQDAATLARSQAEVRVAQRLAEGFLRLSTRTRADLVPTELVEWLHTVRGQRRPS